MHTNELLQFTSQLSVLFVEDHDELRLQTTEILENLFKKVDTYNNGKEALEAYIKYNSENSKNYDIVLTDIKMPFMDGIELTENIYKLNPNQAIIVLSAYDESQYLLKLINLGIQQFLKKPVNYNELIQIFFNVSKKLLDNSPQKDSNNIEIPLAKDTIYSKDTKSIIQDTQNIYLTKFEIIFIELLTQSLGKIYSNENIVLHYQALDQTIDASNIRKLVSKLRKKLPENSLESIYGIGYKFIPYN